MFAAKQHVDGTDQHKSCPKSQAPLLLDLALATGCEVWHTRWDDGYAAIPAGCHREHRPARSRSFRRWLSRPYYIDPGAVPGDQAFQDAIEAMEGRALFDGDEHATPIRVAEHDGDIYLDLCDAEWRAVQMAKSTAARVLRGLVDPNGAPLRCEPREPRDLMIAANNGWTIALDNVSHLWGWLSDALCRLSTGGGFATRTLYGNDEETIFDAQRPVILTGIEEVASHPQKNRPGNDRPQRSHRPQTREMQGQWGR
jgi:hypothetical protein